MPKKGNTEKSKRSLKLFGTDVFVDGGFDIVYLILVFLLLTVGLVMMFSASYVSAKYSAEAGYDSAYYIKKQLVFAVAGTVLMFLISRLNPDFLKKITPIIAVVSIILLIAVLIHPQIIPGKEDFKRWLYIGFSFQPSEVAKLAVIMMTALLLDKYKRPLETKWWVAPAILCVPAIFCVLIKYENHLSCTILVAAIGLALMYLGGADRRWFIYGGLFLIVAVGVVYVFRDIFLDPYQVERIDSLFVKDYNDTALRWQTNQSLFALGSGGFFGLGLGKSRQKYLYMPEPQNDFIFAIVGEELGFFRCVLIILVFAALVYRGFVIATRAKSRFERLTALGISIQLGLQIVLNILVVTDVAPNTGISLPFFSYGGTALVMQLVEVGIMLSISRTGERVRKESSDAEQ